MTETTVNISGMMCGMCEAHICDVIRARFAETGYEVTAVSARPAGEKKGLFGFLKR